MVSHAAYAKAFAASVSCNLRQIGVKGWADFVCEVRSAVFCAEDDVDEEEAERLRHERMLAEFSAVVLLIGRAFSA